MPDTTLQRIDGSALRFHLAGALERPRSLVLLLHGSGTHAANLLPLAARLAAALPEALFVAPDAPQSYRDVLPLDEVAAATQARPDIDWEQSRSWVGRMESAGADAASQRQAFVDVIRPPVRALGRLADLLLARHELPAAALAIYGFSQGGMMALYLATDRPDPCAGVVCHSGHYPGGLEARSHPPTLLLVGAQELAPSQAMSRAHPLTVAALRALGVPLEEHVCPGLGHDINGEAVERVAAFLTRVLPDGGA